MTPRPSVAEFESIVSLIIEARHRAYRKANEELVVLYYNVGRIVSGKVADGAWGKERWMPWLHTLQIKISDSQDLLVVACTG